MPTPGRFEGQHFETVYPNKWQHIIWEIPDLYRDCVTGFSVNIMLAGAPAGASECMSLYIDDMHRKGRSGKQPGIRPAKRCNGLLPQRIQAGST